MTNKTMVNAGRRQDRPADAHDRPMPTPNPTPPTRVPAPESDPQLFVTQDPMDSPQPKPNIRQDKTKGLKSGR